jgi:PAS domain S-box-containing protein
VNNSESPETGIMIKKQGRATKRKLVKTIPQYQGKSIYKTPRRPEPSEQELYTTLANNLQIGVYIIQDRRLQLINRHIQEYTGYTESEMSEMDPLSFIYPDDRRAVTRNAVSMLKGMRVSPYRYRLMTKQGQIKWIMETVTPIIFRRKRAVLGSSMDITEQKEARENLEKLML